MKDRTYHLAVDIGASSGRHIVGYYENHEIKTEEIYRFHNGVKNEDGHLVWDMESLLYEVKKGIDIALSLYRVKSLAIDTWGVDYVLLDGDEIIQPVYAYRDHRTEEVMETVHGIIPFSSLYERTGIQKQSFNTIYQLYYDRVNGRLEKATDFLMIPEYLSFALTGNKVKEYTNATTTSLVNKDSGEYDLDIIKALSLPSRLFTSLAKPKTKVGEYKGVDVLLCATHDTASAVEGMNVEEGEPYLSSGTWSLLGLKVPSPITDEKSMEGNWSNEGGVGYTRYQKNIMGMWLINRLKEELAPSISFTEFNALTESSSFTGYVDAEDSSFLSPESMKDAFDHKLNREGLKAEDYFRSAVISLSKSYGKSIRELEENTKRRFNRLYIVGGGANNELLNRLTEKETGLKVISKKIEATAIGNLKIQMEAYNEL